MEKNKDAEDRERQTEAVRHRDGEKRPTRDDHEPMPPDPDELPDERLDSVSGGRTTTRTDFGTVMRDGLIKTGRD